MDCRLLSRAIGRGVSYHAAPGCGIQTYDWLSHHERWTDGASPCGNVRLIRSLTQDARGTAGGVSRARLPRGARDGAGREFAQRDPRVKIAAGRHGTQEMDRA